jgi:predicted DNA-binding transcriptional regulator YafY
MRADRLLALLLLLQARGRLTAAELAGELEVSERTVYRDVEALSIAGVPVYTERGPGGGISLLDEYRTNLTGLTRDEIQALFTLSIPDPLRQLGVGAELKGALAKLAAALPAERRGELQQARQRIYLDARWWGQAEEPAPFLHTVQQAVWQERRLRIVTRTHFGTEIEVVVEPLGLVAKASEWHLVALRAGQPQAYRVVDLVEAQLLDEPFARPADFDLVAFWEAYRAEVEAQRGLYWVTARVSPALQREFPFHFGGQTQTILAAAGPPDATGWREVSLAFPSLFAARARLLSFGGAAEVLEPLPLRRSLRDFAAQIAARYRDDPPEG